MATNADKLNELAVNIAQVMTDLSGVKIQSASTSVAIAKLAEKMDSLSDSVITHHAQDAEKCRKLDQLYADIHGNGKRGMKVEIEELKTWMGGSKRFVWIMVTSAVGSLVGALITILTSMS